MRRQTTECRISAKSGAQFDLGVDPRRGEHEANAMPQSEPSGLRGLFAAER